MADIQIEINPRKAFRPYLRRHEAGLRWAGMMVHRRGGKSVAATQDMGACALTHTRKNLDMAVLRYAYVAPTQQQAEDIIWNYFEQFFGKIPGVKLNQQKLRVTMPNKATIRLYSGEQYERMRGLYFDGIVLDEYDDLDPVAWSTVIRPTLTDYKGWATFMGTPKGKAALHRILSDYEQRDECYSLRLPASESGIIDDEELADIRNDPEISDAQYRQEYELDVNVSTPGAIFQSDLLTAEEQGRVNDNVLHHEGIPVYSAFDVGLPANTKCWIFQIIGDRINFLQSLTGGVDLDTPAKWAALLTQLANEKGYSFGLHFLPHDGETSWRPTFKEAGLTNVEVLVRPSDKWDDINEAKRAFPRTFINRDDCQFGIRALEHWKTGLVKKSGHYTNDPEHGWSSHWCKAFSLAAWAIACGRCINKAGKSVKPRNRKPKVDSGFGGHDSGKSKSRIKVKVAF